MSGDRPPQRGARPRRASALLTGVLLTLPGCLVFRDQGGVSVDRAALERFEPGVTTRAEVLAELGAPTGLHDTDLVAAMRGGDQLITLPEVTVPEVAVWQQVDLEAELFMLPVFTLWSTARVATRTAMVLFDEQGRVEAVAYREDGT